MREIECSLVLDPLVHHADDERVHAKFAIIQCYGIRPYQSRL